MARWPAVGRRSLGQGGLFQREFQHPVEPPEGYGTTAIRRDASVLSLTLALAISACAAEDTQAGVLPRGREGRRGIARDGLCFGEANSPEKR